MQVADMRRGHDRVRFSRRVGGPFPEARVRKARNAEGRPSFRRRLVTWPVLAEEKAADLFYAKAMKKAVLDLKPTQFALGLREVSRKIYKLKEMGHNARHDYLNSRPIPVVISAKKHYHLIDHHHQARACWEFGIEELPIEVKADFSHLAPAEFWGAMHKSHWIHLHDQFGHGPHAAHLLPEDIRGLADDPCRSLSWALRHAGFYEKSTVAFSEFQWADFLRKEIIVEPGDEGFERALSAAEKIASSPLAKHLPGWHGRLPPPSDRSRGARPQGDH